MRLTPFHGDESTTITKSRDWFALVQRGDLSALLFRDPQHIDPAALAAQELRLLNGVISEYGIGFAASLVGLGAADINEQCDWGADWNYNHSYGHVPGELLLVVARLSSTWLTALSIAIVFVILRLLDRRTAWLGTFVYATMPAVLLNGRRAMYEGALLVTVALVMLSGVILARRIRQQRSTSRDWLWLGIASGLAFASKHNTAILVASLFGVLILASSRYDLPRTLLRAAGAAVVSAGLFLVLNPAWWSAPLQVPGEVMRLRVKLLADQTASIGGVTNITQRIEMIAKQPQGTPQYYEVLSGWPQWIGDQITTYERSGLSGIDWSVLSVFSPLMLVVTMLTLPRRLESITFVIVGLMSLAATFAVTTLLWQRYYLHLAIPWALVYGSTLAALLRLVKRFTQHNWRRTNA
jgi:4-amino-4-deoxy-L-arabinose transferase-like glycosyltransferase